MKVNGKMDVKIEIDKSEQYEITQKFLQKMFDIPSDECYINNKNELIYWWEESMGTHSSTEEEVVRKATKNDKLYFKFMSELAQIYRSKEILNETD